MMRDWAKEITEEPNRVGKLILILTTIIIKY